jgi:hypothetical protein
MPCITLLLFAFIPIEPALMVIQELFTGNIVNSPIPLFSGMVFGVFISTHSFFSAIYSILFSDLTLSSNLKANGTY